MQSALASEELILTLVLVCFLKQILLYDPECYSLIKADIKSLYFVVTQFSKQFKFANKDILSSVFTVFQISFA